MMVPMESSASIEIAKHTLLSCGLILALGTLAAFLAQKIRIPDVALFLLAGIPIVRQVRIRDRVAQTAMSESAFNDAMGAILTFTLLALAGGHGEFSLLGAVFDLAKQSLLGIAAGAVLGLLAALLIAHEKWAFLAEYAPVVTLVAVIGAYFAANGLQASGFMAVFVFGIVLGNKEAFGFHMEAGGAQKLDQFVLATAFIIRLFIFMLLGAQVDFGLMSRYWLGGVAVVTVLMLVARPLTVFLCAWPD